MKRFAELLDRLTYATARNAKLALIADYLRTAPDPDRGYALAALTDGLPGSRPVRRILADLMAPRIDPELYRLSRDYVGDTAETVALLWPDAVGAGEPPRLADVVADLTLFDNAALAVALADWLDRLDATGRWALLKLLTGAPRVGVSARLAKTAVAMIGPESVTADDIEGLWHGLKPPYVDLFAWLEGRGEKPEVRDTTLFRPMMLSHPLEEGDREIIAPEVFAAEWKWDGIRVQVAAGAGDVRVYSRTGDDIGAAFPEIVAAFAGRTMVLDGELLVVRSGEVAGFNDLQQRLNRKSPTKKMMAEHPAHVRLYDALLIDGEDLRALPFAERRVRLQQWHASAHPPRTDVSALVAYDSRGHLERIWAETRGAGVEGLMLKRWTSPYLAGRPKGHWFKWKRAALTADCVLMYAQRGSGKRSSYYSDYTFGAWRGDGTAAELVPVGKAYSGFTDEELLRLDRFVRQNTTERFGPVRAVTASLVLEIAFDSIHRSARHKSGVAMRFPRVHRIRWDKPAAEADRLETLEAMIVA
jgi:DNA ligase-1